MKTVITILFICFNFSLFCQTGKVKIDIIITDTVKPYFLGIYARKEKTPTSIIHILTSGSYFMKDLTEGHYNFEFFSFESSSRRLYIDSVKVLNDSITNLKVIYPGPCRFVYGEDFKPVCPYNHSNKIVKIVYGYPSKKMMKKAKKGRIHLGGCLHYYCDPKYYCIIHKQKI